MGHHSGALRRQERTARQQGVVWLFGPVVRPEQQAIVTAADLFTLAVAVDTYFICCATVEVVTVGAVANSGRRIVAVEGVLHVTVYTVAGVDGTRRVSFAVPVVVFVPDSRRIFVQVVVAILIQPVAYVGCRVARVAARSATFRVVVAVASPRACGADVAVPVQIVVTGHVAIGVTVHITVGVSIHVPIDVSVNV